MTGQGDSPRSHLPSNAAARTIEERLNESAKDPRFPDQIAEYYQEIREYLGEAESQYRREIFLFSAVSGLFALTALDQSAEFEFLSLPIRNPPLVLAVLAPLAAIFSYSLWSTLTARMLMMEVRTEFYRRFRPSLWAQGLDQLACAPFSMNIEVFLKPANATTWREHLNAMLLGIVQLVFVLGPTAVLITMAIVVLAQSRLPLIARIISAAVTVLFLVKAWLLWLSAALLRSTRTTARTTQQESIMIREDLIRHFWQVIESTAQNAGFKQIEPGCRARLQQRIERVADTHLQRLQDPAELARAQGELREFVHRMVVDARAKNYTSLHEDTEDAAARRCGLFFWC